MKLRIIFIMMTFFAVFMLLGCEENKKPDTRTEYIHVGPNWDAIHHLKASKNTFRVELNGKETLKAGDTISFSVKSAKPGNVWVIQVDPDDNVSLIFPNPSSPDNTISAGKWIKIPPVDADYTIVAEEPFGKSTLAAIVTTGKADLNDVLGAQKSMTKALSLLEDQPSWGIGHIVVNVTQ